jgi:hypothetical protein
MTSFGYGKGEVIVTAALYMTPKYSDKSVEMMIPGSLKFPWFEKVFEKFRQELYPLSLKSGKVLWGLNRTKAGWWVWALNNQGVTKYPDIAEKIDESAAENVEFDVSKLKAGSVVELLSGKTVPSIDGRISYTIPAGGLAIFELK